MCYAVVSFSAWVLSQTAATIIVKVWVQRSDVHVMEILLAVNCVCVVSWVIQAHLAPSRGFCEPGNSSEVRLVE